MKYSILILMLFSLSFSCKTKKNATTSATPFRDTFFIPNPENKQLEMHITDKYISPTGEWILMGIMGSTDDEVTKITMNITSTENGTEISGYDGCNSYQANLTAFDKKRFEVSSFSVTERQCIIPAKYDKVFYKYLKSARTYSATKSYVVLRDEKGLQILEFKRKE